MSKKKWLKGSNKKQKGGNKKPKPNINKKSTKVKKNKSTEKKLVKSKSEALKNGVKQASSSLSNKFCNRQNLSLRERMMHVIKSAKFRYTNEQLYTSDSKTIKACFENSEDFKSYHEGFAQQVKEWPLNPLDLIIKSLKKSLKAGESVADMGCGEARLARSLPDVTVHSFDLVASDATVTAADMAHVPLPSASVRVVVFCLSLMARDVSKYIKEANRILVNNGILKIAEVESRLEAVDKFIDSIKKHGFTLVNKNLSHKFFLFFDFKKVSSGQSKLPEVLLNPCTYKKR